MRFFISNGKRLRYFRTLRNMTQQQLGIAVGFSEQTADVRIAQYESGARTPKEKTVIALANALDISPAALSVPPIEDEAALMQLLFALEDDCGVALCSLGCIPDTRLGKALSEWRQLADKRKNGEITKKEYDEWRYSFSL